MSENTRTFITINAPIEIGQPARLTLSNNDRVRTSPVQHYIQNPRGEVTTIITKNHVYRHETIA